LGLGYTENTFGFGVIIKPHMKERARTHVESGQTQKGFTLVELLVSLAIFTVITTLAVVNNNQFNSSILLTNLAYEVGLSVRQAQFYGIAVRKNSTSGFDAGYGIHFDLADPKTYYLFEDRTIDHICDVTECATSSLVEGFKLVKGNFISKICVDGSSGLTCTSPTGFQKVDISFVRPNPDAYITRNSVSGNYTKAEICIASPSGTKRRVIVESTGQIAVSTDPGPNCI
jgi:prepilin-type N-terminal cleavage/methylation domain-containing protein